MVNENTGYKTEQDDDTNKPGTNVPPPTGSALQTIGTATPSQGAPQKPQGSGRFVNLQKYLTANQGAGNRIAGAVGQDVQKQATEQQAEAQKYYQDLGKSVSKAQQTLQTGQGFEQTLGQMGESIKGAQSGGQAQRQNVDALGQFETFVNDPNFSQFQNIQSGQGVNEALLALQNQRAAQQTGKYQQLAQGQQQQLGSESGRFGLLRQTFGGNARPDYTSGEQRLDQLFLSRSDALKDIQQAARQRAREAERLSDLRQAAGIQAGEAALEERRLVDNLNKQAAANEQAFLDMLGSYVDPVQAQRQADWDALNRATQSYRERAKNVYDVPTGDISTQKGTPSAINFTAEQLQALGVDPNMAVSGLEAFREGAPDTYRINEAADFATQGRAATSYQDIADQADVNRYAALAKIAGIAPERLTQASDLGAAYTSKEGDKSLTSRLTAGNEAFDQTFFGDGVGTNMGRVGTKHTAAGFRAKNIDELRRVTNEYERQVAAGNWGYNKRAEDARKLLDQYERLKNMNLTGGSGSSKGY